MRRVGGGGRLRAALRHAERDFGSEVVPARILSKSVSSTFRGTGLSDDTMRAIVHHLDHGGEGHGRINVRDLMAAVSAVDADDRVHEHADTAQNPSASGHSHA